MSEDGYTRIVNEIVEALARIRISGRETQILWVILRKTYGWNKKMDRIALSQFEKLTGIPRKKCFQLLKQLSNRKIITKSVPHKGDGYIVSYGLNESYNGWKVSPIKGVSPIKVPGVPHKGSMVSPIKGTTKETLTKDTRQKIYVETSDEVRLSELLLSLILKNSPNFKKPNDIQKWAKVIDLTHRIDDRSFMDLEETINWLFKENVNGDFPFVVQSPGALRDKFDRIQVAMGRVESDAKNQPHSTTKFFNIEEHEKKTQAELKGLREATI